MDQWLRGSATPACHLGGLRGTESQHFPYGLMFPGTMGVPPPCLCAHVCESMGSRIFPHVYTYEHAYLLTYMHMCIHVHTKMGTHTYAHIHTHAYTCTCRRGSILCSNTRTRRHGSVLCSHTCTHRCGHVLPYAHLHTCAELREWRRTRMSVCTYPCAGPTLPGGGQADVRDGHSRGCFLCTQGSWAAPLRALPPRLTASSQLLVWEP